MLRNSTVEAWLDRLADPRARRRGPARTTNPSRGPTAHRSAATLLNTDRCDGWQHRTAATLGGQGVGLVTRPESAAEIVHSLVSEADEVLTSFRHDRAAHECSPEVGTVRVRACTVGQVGAGPRIAS